MSKRVKLFLLVGCPGVGKSTYANRLLEVDSTRLWVSSDNIRKELYGDPSIQGDPAQVFGEMRKRTLDAFERGNSVIYDATNMTRKDRAGIIAACPKFVTILCVVIWAPIEVCIERDKNRERSVGRKVIDKMVRRFQFPYYDEGIDSIEVLRYFVDFDDKSYRDKLAEDMKIPHDNPNHQLPIFDHCMATARYAEENKFGISYTTAALLHDCGKSHTKTFINTHGEVTETAHYYNHESVSAYLAAGVVDDIEALWLISSHMEPFHNSKYYKGLPTFLKERIDKLHECDLAAH